MYTSLIQNGILIALLGTLCAGVVSVLVRSAFGRRVTYVLLAAANACGVVSAFLYLKTGADIAVIATLPVGYNTMLRMDFLSAIFYLIVTFVSVCCAWYAIGYVERYQKTYHLPSLGFATAMFMFGMQAVLLSMNIAGFMVSWEVMSIASFFLVMADREVASVKAALLYLVMTHLGAGAIFAGFFIFTNGALLADISALSGTAQALPASSVILGLLLFLFGFGSKAGLVPFHIWLPEAHPQAPSHVSALMSGVMLKVAIYGFLRTISASPLMPEWFGLLVIGLGLLSAIFGVLYAVIETDIKRTLAFSSIENIGLIFTMIGLAFYAFSQSQPLLGELCLVGAVFHAVVHALFKSGLFLTAGAIISETHHRSLETMGGLAKRMPLLSGAFLVLALSAAALPPFGAFFGEWLFLQSVLGALASAFEQPVFAGILIGVMAVFAFVGGLAIFAMVKLFAIACLGEPRSEEAAHAKDPQGFMLGPILLFALGMIASGAFAPYVLSLVKASGLTTEQAFAFAPAIEVPFSGSLIPFMVFAMLVGCLLLVWLLRRLGSNVKQERLYHTWDCGQPITAGMEYTATAFSAPIRFFFRILLRTRKAYEVRPILETNPWIAKRSMSFETRPIFMEWFYVPLERLMTWLSTQVRKIQNGSIQLYLALIFVTLIATIIISL